jgi:hypothetical protein
LAAISEETIEDVEREIAAAESRKTRRKPTIVEVPQLIAETFKDRPALVPSIQTLANKYENKTLLPHLRDVQRFLERLGVTKGRLKSRQTALGPFIKALATMNSDDIAKLSAVSEGETDSDYALLAREIMSGGAARNRIQRSIGDSD